MQVILTMPKFKLNYTVDDMKSKLELLGMRLCFSNKADFSGMANVNPGDIFISHVIHTAVVDVNEQGTEAAASTATVMRLRSVAIRPVVQLTVRCFIF